MSAANHTTESFPVGSVPIPGYEHYRICDGGGVWTDLAIGGHGIGLSGHRVGPWRRVSGNLRDGYVYVGIMVAPNVRRKRNVHALLLTAFVGPCPPGMEACHNDGFRSNNRLYNLRWDTRKANAADRRKHGTDTIGENHNCAILKEVDIPRIFEMNALGMSGRAIADVFGLSSTCSIYLILRRKLWKHVPVDPALCKRNNFLEGEGQPGAVIKETDVLEAFRLASQGWTQKEIASALGVSRSTIGRILRRQGWSHVEVPEELLSR